MHYDSQYELRFAEELLKSVSPGDCVWDVGANVGYFTKQLAERVGLKGSVIAIEPFQFTLDLLRIETRTFPQVHCVHAALGPAETEMRADGIPGSPGNTLAKVNENGAGELIRVTTATN